ncbi:MAG: TIGR04013 family B12-binding domain/radical SAM domain-containing protein [Elusimicrobiota bacterium]
MDIYFHSTNTNKYSINSLTSAIENINGLNIYFFSSFNEIEEKIKNEKNTVIAFSFMSYNNKSELSLAKFISNKFSKITLIAGGPHITDKNTKELSETFNHLFIGEGEISLRDFLLDKRHEKIIKSSKLVDINQFSSISEKYKRFGSIEITRGCLHRCLYCQTPSIFGFKQRHKKLENILKEIEILLRNNFRDIRFITPDLSSYGSENGKPDYKKINELVCSVNKTIKGKGRVFMGSFPSEIRPEHVNHDFCEILKGNTSSKRIIIGAQSLSDRILKKINRGHSADDVIKAVSLLKKYGFDVDVDFIFGFPFETEEDINITKNGIEILTKKYNARIHIHYFMPLPQTGFENLKPKPLDKELRRYLSSLTAQKLAFGQWEKQLYHRT